MIANLAGERKSFLTQLLARTLFLVFVLWVAVVFMVPKNALAAAETADTQTAERKAELRWTSLNLCVDQFIQKQFAHLAEAGFDANEQTRQAARVNVQFVADHRGRVERIVAYAPQHVLATTFSNPILVQHLRSKNLVVTVLNEPDSLAQALALQAELFRLLHGAEASKSNVPLSALNTPEAKANLLHEQRVVWLQPNHYSFGSDTLFDELLTSLGAENLGAIKGSGLVRFTLEDVLTLQPDVILLEVADEEHFSLAHSQLAHRALQRYLANSDAQLLLMPRTVMGCLAYELDTFVQLLLPQER